MNLLLMLASLATLAASLALYYRRHDDKKARRFTAEIEALQDAYPEVILGPACNYTSHSDETAADVAGILATYHRHNTGWCEADGSAYTATFTDDADFVAFDGTHTIGRDQIEASHQELFDTFLKNTCLRGYVKRIRFLSDNAAVVHVISGTEFDRSGTVRRPSIQTYVAVKRESGWRFSSFHNSRIDPIESWSLPRKMWLGMQTVLLRR